MPLITPLPIDELSETFRAGLATFLPGPDCGQSGQVVKELHLGGDPVLPILADLMNEAGTLEHNAQQVFTLDLKDLLAGRGIEAAGSIGWRFFAGTGPDQTIFGFCCSALASDTWELASLGHGARAWQVLQESQQLENLPCVRNDHPYELRFLTIPGILVEAFWLHSLSGGDDQVVVSPAPPNQVHKRLNTEPVFPMATFIEIVRELAMKQLSYPPC